MTKSTADQDNYHRMEKELDKLNELIPQVETLFDYLENRKTKVEQDMEELLPYLPTEREE